MSSLLLSASPWKNEENDNTPMKKRTSTLRRQVNTPQIQNDFQRDLTYIKPNVDTSCTASVDKIYEGFEKNMDDVKAANIDRNSRIDELLNKITNTENGDSKLGDFKPMEHPSVQVKRDFENPATPKYNPTLPSFAAASIQMKHGSGLISEDNTYGNYANSYAPSLQRVQTHAQPSAPVVVDTKLLEKINYLIHMMEQQKDEKTNNITEEFILYTFLGIFIIYVIDSFARVGKYTR